MSSTLIVIMNIKYKPKKMNKMNTLTSKMLCIEINLVGQVLCIIFKYLLFKSENCIIFML